jgi:hypothetical protein
LHPTKTRLIRFGRHAAKQREELGEERPEPFDFLGFTHFCTRSRKWGSFVIGRKTIKKRMLKQLQAVKMELRRRMHDPIAKTGAWLKRVTRPSSVIPTFSHFAIRRRMRLSAIRCSRKRIVHEWAMASKKP